MEDSKSFKSSPFDSCRFVSSSNIVPGPSNFIPRQHLTTRQWITVTIFGLANFFSAMVMSLQAPFYPPEAEKKGASATEYGLVFGIYELIIFLVSPLVGKYINKVGPTIIFNAGIFTTSLSCILFGFLDKIEGHFPFIFLSFFLRIMEALGAASFITATFTITACEFPDSVATTFASLETFFGLGLICGPALGGALFELGGFVLPFALTGCALLGIGVAASLVMPKIETLEDLDGRSAEGFGIFSILKIPGVAVSIVALIMTSNSVGFLCATLEPHLRQFNLSPLEMGLMFIIYGGVYAITAPGIGWVCDKLFPPLYLMLGGACCIFAAFILIGPAPFLQMDTVLWVTAVGLVLQGLGFSFNLVSCFISCLKESTNSGFPDNVSTYGVVSGLWTSSLSLGAFIGPSIAGILFDSFGFRSSTWYIFSTELFVIILLTIFITLRPTHNNNLLRVEELGEHAPLLTSINGMP